MKYSSAPPFTGFPRDAREWFRGIAANNSRDWFQANRPTYDRCVRQPLESLLAELERYGEGKVFRPNRDTRFAKDKSPYKTNAAATIPRPGGSYYIHVDADMVYVGGGSYHFDRGQLARFRAAVDTPKTVAGLDRAIAKLEAAGLEPGSRSLTGVPRGFSKDHPRIDLLRRSGLIGGVQHPWAKWISTPAAKDRIVNEWKAIDPLLRWLHANVGPPTEWG
jgi:uncharacterized protein (TIGR02453 family)